MSDDPITIHAAPSSVQPPPAAVPGELASSTVTAGQAAAVDGSLVARLRAKREQLQHRSKRIPVPPDDVWGGELVLVCKPARLRDNMPTRALVIEATERLEILNPDTGEFDPVEDGWAGIGRLMGIEERATQGEIVTAVCGAPEIVAGLAEQIIAFIVGRESQIEQALGE